MCLFPCRHFADNWVVAWGPGFRSDLAVEWESFKAARSALSGVVTPSRARDQAATYAAALPGLQKQLASFLLEGKLKVGCPPRLLHTVIDRSPPEAYESSRQPLQLSWHGGKGASLASASHPVWQMGGYEVIHCKVMPTVMMPLFVDFLEFYYSTH